MEQSAGAQCYFFSEIMEFHKWVSQEVMLLTWCHDEMWLSWLHLTSCYLSRKNKQTNRGSWGVDVCSTLVLFPIETDVFFSRLSNKKCKNTSRYWVPTVVNLSNSKFKPSGFFTGPPTQTTHRSSVLTGCLCGCFFMLFVCSSCFTVTVVTCHFSFSRMLWHLCLLISSKPPHSQVTKKKQ